MPRAPGRSLDGSLGRGPTDVERLKQQLTCRSRIAHRGIERRLVRLRRSMEPTDLAKELECGVVQLVSRRLAVVLAQTLDVPAHVGALPQCAQRSQGSRVRCGALANLAIQCMTAAMIPAHTPAITPKASPARSPANLKSNGMAIRARTAAPSRHAGQNVARETMRRASASRSALALCVVVTDGGSTVPPELTTAV